MLAALVVLGVWLQVYFIASFFFGARGCARRSTRTWAAITHIVEVLVFLAALGAWWRNWGRIGHAFALGVIGTIQIWRSTDGRRRGCGGLHGLLALVILVMAVFIVKWDAEALGLTRASRGGGDAGAAPPRPLP